VRRFVGPKSWVPLALCTDALVPLWALRRTDPNIIWLVLAWLRHLGEERRQVEGGNALEPTTHSSCPTAAGKVNLKPMWLM
jgi:hypothetical protein